MSDNEQVSQALAELWDIVRCRCNEAYTGRGLHDPDCECDSAEAVKIVADRIEALEAKLATCEKYRDAYDEMGRIGTQAVRDLEAKLAKAVEGQKVNALEQILEERGAVFDAMVDAAEDAAGKDVSFNVVVGRALRAAIAEIKGESHE